MSPLAWSLAHVTGGLAASFGRAGACGRPLYETIGIGLLLAGV